MNEQEAAVMKQMAIKQAQEALVQHVMKNRDNYPDLFCQKCDSQYFNQGFRAKAISQFDPMNKLGEPQAVHFSVWICRGCGTEIVLAGPDCNMIEKAPSKEIIN